MYDDATAKGDLRGGIILLIGSLLDETHRLITLVREDSGSDAFEENRRTFSPDTNLMYVYADLHTISMELSELRSDVPVLNSATSLMAVRTRVFEISVMLYKISKY